MSRLRGDRQSTLGPVPGVSPRFQLSPAVVLARTADAEDIAVMTVIELLRRLRHRRTCLARAVLSAFVLLALSSPVVADWINLTGAETAPNIAEIYVLDDRVEVVLEVYIGNLDIFADLVPDALLRDASARAPMEDRLRRFSRE